MKKVLLDLNIVLDVILEREPHVQMSLELWATALRSQVTVAFPAHGVTTMFYVVSRVRGPAVALKGVISLFEIAEIVPVDDAVLRRAVALGWPDFEDAVCAAAAEAARCDLIVSRDLRGFPQSPVLVVDPATALLMITGHPGRVSERRAGGYGAKRPPRLRGRPAAARTRQRRTGTVQD